MMKIDIEKLSEAKLIDLNHRIVERLPFLSQLRAHLQMLDFKIGERVSFHLNYPLRPICAYRESHRSS
jgi:hypothetical protein